MGGSSILATRRAAIEQTLGMLCLLDGQHLNFLFAKNTESAPTMGKNTFISSLRVLIYSSGYSMDSSSIKKKLNRDIYLYQYNKFSHFFILYVGPAELN